LIYIVLLAFVLQPLNGFWSGDQGVKLIQIQNLIIQRFHTNALIYPGERFDPERLASPLRGQYITHAGQPYAMFSDAFAAASAIPFFLFGFPGLYFLPVAATIGTLLLTNALARQFLSPAWHIPTLLVSGLATPIGLYALLFWEHAPTTTLITAAVWLMVCVTRGAAPWRIALAGLLIGIAAWLRIETLIGVPALALALIIDRRMLLVRWIWLACGALIGLLPLFAYNQIIFGSFLGAHVLAHLAPAAPSHPFDLSMISTYLASRSAWARANLVSLDRPLVALLVAIALGAVLSQRIIGIVRSRWILLGTTILVCLATDIYRNQILSTSLMMTMPFALLTMLPREQPAGANDPKIDLLSVFVGAFLLLCLLAPLPDGGAQWGPRMILPILPLLVIIGLFKISGMLRSQILGAQQIVLIVAVTLAISTGALSLVAGILRAQDANRNVVLISDAVVRSQQQVIVTDDISVPALLAQLFYDGRLIYWVDQPEHADALLGSLKRHRVERMYVITTSLQRLHDTSLNWAALEPIGDPQRLPYRLTGQVYAIHP
jgi:hypothetical protein